jgi:hypothetical protein
LKCVLLRRRPFHRAINKSSGANVMLVTKPQWAAL